jgi:transposase
MPRLKVVEAPQHGVGHGNGAGARALGGRVRQGNSPKKTVGKKAPRPKPAKKRVFLSKDQQALLILRYKELPKQKKGSKARGNALTALCKEFDVSEAYPRQLIAALKQNELLPVRDGVGGAPEKIEEHEVDFITRTLEEHAYDLTYRQLSTLTGIPATSLWRFVKETAGWREVNKGTRPRLSDANTYGRYFWAEDALDDDFDLQVDVDARIVAACKAPRRGGPRIELREQIAQSPCTNLCDLGFFRSIDSRLPKLKSFNLPEFIEQIEEAYNEYPSEKLTALADMKMRVVQCIYNAAGDNDFKLPHRQK